MSKSLKADGFHATTTQRQTKTTIEDSSPIVRYYTDLSYNTTPNYDSDGYVGSGIDHILIFNVVTID